MNIFSTIIIKTLSNALLEKPNYAVFILGMSSTTSHHIETDNTELFHTETIDHCEMVVKRNQIHISQRLLKRCFDKTVFNGGRFPLSLT